MQAEPSALLEIAAGALLGLMSMAVIQAATPWLPGNDSFYHVRMARLLPELGFVHEFPWLRWTIFRDHFVSHHHGFHVLLFPFVWLSERLTGDLVLGGKAACVVAMACTGGLFAALLRVIGARSRGLWLMLLCCVPWHFWLRLAYVRAPIAALPLLLLAVLLTWKYRPIWLGLLAFAFTHVYGGAVLFPLIPLAFLVGHVLRGSASQRQVWLVAAALAGIAAGLVINPYFPRNFEFLQTQIFEIGLAAPADVGNEWKPYDTSFLLVNSAPLAAVWVAALVRRFRSRVKLDGDGVALLLLNLAFLLLTLKARRFVEYWPAFALLNAAQLARVLPGSDASRRARSDGVMRNWVIPIAISVCTVLTLRAARAGVKPAEDLAALRDAMRFLERTSPRGALVLTDDWDVFPECFYFNQHNTYAVGLDPVFTLRRYPALWERYKRITRGETPSTLPPELAATGGPPDISLGDIASEFGARFVLVAHDHPALYRQLAASPAQFELVFPEAAATDASDAQPHFSIFAVK